MIKKVLIANRGEIACRVMRTCQRLGIKTVAVYSEADAKALFVEMADEAYHIGPAAARESYLVAEKILEVAKKSGADAVHPGYGFLSENEEFAEACEKAGVIFIGPPPAAILAMGGKSEAKALMERAKVPLVPGYHGDKQEEKFLAGEAEKIGFPVLIKASAGGGGKGMRVVENAGQFSEQLQGARREAKAAFGDDHVLIEKYLVNPRHVEIQVFADKFGNTVYLFERDCSIQRRHQKVLEEAPAPGLSEATRRKMGEAAVAAAKAIGYVGAGTVEFLLDASENFYFMEMNTRLQVEHPVTEYITGLDLVEQQIRAAEGHKLAFTQDDLKINGHAMEVRLYAEDPANNFLPGAGQIKYLRFPMESDAVRVDTGVREAPFGNGDTISIHYDPMIAKIIAWGKDRDAAIANLKGALDQTLVTGPKTNLVFLRRLLDSADFKAGKVSTSYIQKHEAELLPPKAAPSNTAYALAALGLLRERDVQPKYEDAGSPWNDLSGWRIAGAGGDTFVFENDGKEIAVGVSTANGIDHPELTVNGEKIAAHIAPAMYDMSFDARLAGEQYNAVLLHEGRHLTLLYNGHSEELQYRDPLAYEEGEQGGSGCLTAPMPGKVVAVRVQLGDKVSKGQPLVIVEAMKMEHTIIAPADGIVEKIHAGVGDQVNEKYELISLK
ncbi:MAG TPA: acetyl/propionyl/methylcrotonyl-CoA carboxylase subunit alpha [Patescibacteria group bacterium]|nr:acetyl/propionyl/methylcrotonyl-CoA carboxylase subunit alpha [Patescibacteria group bacterium]